MQIRIKQECPQCGGVLEISESDHLFTCPYCGTNNFLRATGPHRYVLPCSAKESDCEQLLYAPYIRFKGNIFIVTERGVTNRAVDTTQLGCLVNKLPPSLGVRPQAMQLNRLGEQTAGRFIKLGMKVGRILEKAALISDITVRAGNSLYHRAFIGETMSFIYLPLAEKRGQMVDAVNGYALGSAERFHDLQDSAMDFNERWRVDFLPTLCPQCGGKLDGEGDALVLLCDNCDSTWHIENNGLQRVNRLLVPGQRNSRMYLPFWRITAQLPAVEIYSFFDYVKRTNTAMVPKPQWRDRPMSFWIPAFKLSPAIFLRAAKQMTNAQWRVTPKEGRMSGELYPVTLPASEARQSIKVTLAEATMNRRRIFPHLPSIRVKPLDTSLVYLPFVDNAHEWLQPETITVIPKNILRFGRSM